jgi:2-dehydro-3-deoxygluconokinase
MKKKIITFGEIMLRLAAPANLRFSQATEFNATYCGSELNVAVSLANFGLNTEFVTRLPNNDISQACLMQLKAHNVGISHIILGGDRLGLFYLETGAVTRPSKVIYDRLNSSFSTIKPEMIDWSHILRETEWFHWSGIIPALSQSASETCLEAINVANKLGITVSCDLNYRKNLWNYGKFASDIMPELVKGCDVILGNEEDCEKIFSIKPKGFDATNTIGEINPTEFEEVCSRMVAMFPKCKKIALTLRGSINANINNWAGVLFSEGILKKSINYKITHVVDRVGSGDSFMAGLIYSLISYPGEDQRALDFATAASCLKHTIYGDFNRVTISEVENLTKGDSFGRISR